MKWSLLFTSAAFLFMASALMLLAAPPADAYWVENGMSVGQSDSTQILKAIAPDGSGGAIVVWSDLSTEPNYRSLYVQKINQRGEPQWALGGVPVQLGAALYPSVELLPDGMGGVYVLLRAGSLASYVSCNVNKFSPDGVLQWSKAPFVSGGSVGGASITTDGSGGCIVCWDDDRGPNRGVYIQRFDAAGNRLWYNDGVSVGSNLGQQTSPRVTSLGTESVVVWKDARSSPGPGLYAQMVDASGSTVWGGYAMPVCTGTQTKEEYQILTDNQGLPVIAWVDDRNGNQDIYMQTLQSDGSPAWTTDGVPVCTAAYSQTFPRMIPYGFGGAIIIWRDVRNLGPGSDLYGQYVEGHGVGQWGTDGKLLCPVISLKENPQLIAAQNDAIITWSDNRSGELDVYAQKIDGNGDALWPADGVAITDDGFQEAPEVAPDGEYGAIVAWNDSRIVFNQEVRAHRIYADGIVANPPPIILSILDIPADEGGYARIELRASNRDLPAVPFPQVSFYNVWRKIDTQMVAARSSSAGMDARSRPELLADLSIGNREAPISLSELEAATLGLPSGSWESIGLHVALQQASYYFTVPTRQDSSQSGTHWETFVVSAHTTDPDLFFISTADSGYSVDNVAPVPPLALAGSPNYSQAGLQLSWSPNQESDLWYYGIYRGTDGGFVPSAGNLVATPTNPGWLDAEWSLSAGYYYKVSAVDIHGNESGFALLQPEQVTGVMTPEVPNLSYLGQNYPNPFNPATTISFGLQRSSHVSLIIYDLAGRLVRVIIEGDRPAGYHTDVWNGRDEAGRAVSSGVYFYRLETESITRTRKMNLLR